MPLLCLGKCAYVITFCRLKFSFDNHRLLQYQGTMWPGPYPHTQCHQSGKYNTEVNSTKSKYCWQPLIPGRPEGMSCVTRVRQPLIPGRPERMSCVTRVRQLVHENFKNTEVFHNLGTHRPTPAHHRRDGSGDRFRRRAASHKSCRLEFVSYETELKKKIRTIVRKVDL